MELFGKIRNGQICVGIVIRNVFFNGFGPIVFIHAVFVGITLQRGKNLIGSGNKIVF